MFPRLIFTEIGRKLKDDLEEEKRFSKVRKFSPSPSPSRIPLNKITTILTNDDDKPQNEDFETQQKVKNLLKLKTKEERTSYIRKNLMTSLQKPNLPKYFEKKFEDSVNTLTSFYLPSKFQKKTQNNPEKSRNQTTKSSVNSSNDVLNESLRLIHNFENKMIKIYDKYETFKLQEEKNKQIIQEKVNNKINLNPDRQFFDSKKTLKEFYDNHQEEINIMKKVSGEDERMKDRILKIHGEKYEKLWKNSSFPEKKTNLHLGEEFDYSGYQDVIKKRLLTRLKNEKLLYCSNDYNMK